MYTTQSVLKILETVFCLIHGKINLRSRTRLMAPKLQSLQTSSKCHRAANFVVVCCIWVLFHMQSATLIFTFTVRKRYIIL